jgi:hypothetical protein
MSIFSSLFKQKADQDECDELCRLVRESDITTREAWDIINTKREERGVEPLEPPPPSFEELMGAEKPYPRDRFQ